MKVQCIINNRFGEFKTNVIEMSDDIYTAFKNNIKNFHHSGFDLTTDEGEFVVFPPDIVKESYIKLIIKDE